jgi:hypothetical protein
MMAFVAGVLFGGVLLFAPRYGLISRLMHQFLLGLKIIRDDTLGFLYRHRELASPGTAAVQTSQVREALKAGIAVDLSLWGLIRRNLVKRTADGLTLTQAGLDIGRNLVRSHRLWETYLCDIMGLCDADLHKYAHELEHYTNPKLQNELGQETGNPKFDPHQRRIPEL